MRWTQTPREGGTCTQGERGRACFSSRSRRWEPWGARGEEPTGSTLNPSRISIQYSQYHASRDHVPLLSSSDLSNFSPDRNRHLIIQDLRIFNLERSWNRHPWRLKVIGGPDSSEKSFKLIQDLFWVRFTDPPRCDLIRSDHQIDQWPKFWGSRNLWS